MRGEPYGGLGRVDPIFAMILACLGSAPRRVLSQRHPLPPEQL